jgi:hypothetical protein
MRVKHHSKGEQFVKFIEETDKKAINRTFFSLETKHINLLKKSNGSLVVMQETVFSWFFLLKSFLLLIKEIKGCISFSLER